MFEMSIKGFGLWWRPTLASRLYKCTLRHDGFLSKAKQLVLCHTPILPSSSSNHSAENAFKQTNQPHLSTAICTDIVLKFSPATGMLKSTLLKI